MPPKMSSPESQGPASKETQIPMLLELSTDVPDQLTKADYDLLDRRFGGIVDEYIRDKKIVDGVFQGGSFAAFFKRTQDDAPAAIITAYLRNKNFRFSKYQKTAPWSSFRVIKKADESKKRQIYSVNAPSHPAIKTRGHFAAGDDSLDEDQLPLI